MARRSVADPIRGAAHDFFHRESQYIMLLIDRRDRFAILVGAAACLGGCGEDSVIGPDEFHRVGGHYTGSIEGTTSVGPFVGVMLITLSQSEGTLTGTYDFNGDIYHTEHDRKYYQGGGGTVEGTLASGPSPRLSLTLTPDDCQAESWPTKGVMTTDAGRSRSPGVSYCPPNSATPSSQSLTARS